MTTSRRAAGHAVRRLGHVLRACAVLLLAYVVVAPAQVMTADGAAAAGTWTLRDPFSREVVQRGDVAVNPYRIAHVHEVQWRLKRVGLFDVQPTGTFGPLTEAAVKAFQRRNGLAATGRVGPRTWTRLIRQSLMRDSCGTSRRRSGCGSMCTAAGADLRRGRRPRYPRALAYPSTAARPRALRGS